MSISIKIRETITRLLVRFGQVKSSPMELFEIDEMINNWLPEKFKIAVSGGDAELEILNVKLSICDETANQQRLNAILFCNFKVKMNGSTIFNTHLNAEIKADPDYSIENKSVGVTNAELVKIDLINDKDSFIKDVSNFANGILPSPLKDLFNLALASSTAILGEEVVSGMTRYLSMYNSGSQQTIIDYHHQDIENKIIDISNDSEMRYVMDETDFEEKLFADYGKSIGIQDGKLLFHF
ncbi:MAG: hypothetical protein COA86_07995 [Kangiella sp.]|nr:MAG: hypothetical protein COA86_07995 [Kangiella sp.]